MRALPTVGVLFCLTVIIAPHFHGRTDTGYLIPTEIVLVLLAIPPILSNTYAGVQNVDPAVRDAARGMGMTGSQVLLKVELPDAACRSSSPGCAVATLQVIATATIASYVPLGGLGRFIYDGLAQQDFPQMIGGGVLVALLALLTDSLLALIQRLRCFPRCLRPLLASHDGGRTSRGRHRPSGGRGSHEHVANGPTGAPTGSLMNRKVLPSERLASAGPRARELRSGEDMKRKTMPHRRVPLRSPSAPQHSAACGKDSSQDHAPAASGTSSGGQRPTIASKLILGGPPEFKTRADGIARPAKNYGVTFSKLQAPRHRRPGHRRPR